MGEEERVVYESLPDPVVIYRGYLPRRNLRGYGWTLNRRCAEWFAVRLSDVGRVAEGRVARQDVLAYFNERKEEEILVDPANVTVKRRWEVTGPMKRPSHTPT